MSNLSGIHHISTHLKETTWPVTYLFLRKILVGLIIFTIPATILIGGLFLLQSLVK